MHQYEIKGAGGFDNLRKVKIEFYVVSNRRERQLLDAFLTGSKNIVPSRS